MGDFAGIGAIPQPMTVIADHKPHRISGVVGDAKGTDDQAIARYFLPGDELHEGMRPADSLFSSQKGTEVGEQRDLAFS